MSIFLWQTVPSIGTYIRQANDDRSNDPPSYYYRISWFEDEYYEPLWSRSRGIDDSVGVLDSAIKRWPVRWEYDVRWSGARSKKKFTGITKDLNGDILPGCTVQLFRTLDDLIISETVSDTIGYYEIYSQYDTAHYLVAYKAGAQHVAGTTKNTILGT